MSSSEDYLDQLLNGMSSEKGKGASSPDSGKSGAGAFSDDPFGGENDLFGGSDEDFLRELENDLDGDSDGFLKDLEKELQSDTEADLLSSEEDEEGLFFRNLDDLVNMSRAEADETIDTMMPTSQRASDENFNLTDGALDRGNEIPDSIPDDIRNLLEPTGDEGATAKSEPQPEPSPAEKEGPRPSEEELDQHAIGEYELGEEIPREEMDIPERPAPKEKEEASGEEGEEEEIEVPDTEAIAAAAAAESGIVDENAVAEDGEDTDDLLDLLNGLQEGDADDISALLSQDASGVQELSEEEMEKLQGELNDEASGEGNDGEDEEDKLEGKFHTRRKRKKEKRKTGNKGGGRGGEGKKDKGPGFFAKLLALLFGSEDDISEENMIQVPPDENAPVDENLAILQELDAEGEGEPGSAPKGKKKKDKKEKKEKKPKKEKPKKEKKPPKEKKPKKERPPKEKDTTPPLPKKPVIVVALFAVSLLVLILLSTKLLGSENQIGEAKEAYENGDYVGAYTLLTGMKLGESDAELFEKAHILATIQKPALDADVLYDMGKYDMALDSLVRSIGRCYNYEEVAQTYGITDTIAVLRDTAAERLMALFGLSEEDARAIYEEDDREDYTIRIHEVLRSLGQEEPEE